MTNGSEKQITLAEQIKADVVEMLTMNIALNTAIENGDDADEEISTEMMIRDIPSIDPEYSNEFLTALKNVVVEIDDAMFFIDNRDQSIELTASRTGLVFNRNGSDVRVKINADGSMA